MDQRAGRRYRVKRRKDFQRLFEQGRQAADSRVSLLALRNDLPHSRAGVAVSGRHGKAVQRNRIKRLCREAFRLVRGELPSGWDYMIVPRVGARLTLRDVQASLRKLAPRVARAGGDGGERP